MRTPNRSFGVVLSITGLILYGVYTSWTAVSQEQPALWVTALPALVAGVGVALGVRWSQFVVYALAVTAAGTLGYTTWLAHDAGYFVRSGATLTTLSLVIASLPTLLFVGCSLVLRKYFARNGGSNNALERTREG